MANTMCELNDKYLPIDGVAEQNGKLKIDYVCLVLKFLYHNGMYKWFDFFNVFFNAILLVCTKREFKCSYAWLGSVF